MMIEKNKRINFGKSKNIPKYPDFLDIQLKSYHEFININATPEERKKLGLYKVFQENFPISDSRNNFVLEFLDYFLEPPKHSISESIAKGLTYAVPLKARLKLYCNDPEHEDFETVVQDVFLGNIPYITPKGSFIINGAERVVVSQLHRSPGVFFGQSRHANGTKLYSARVIPFKGAWIEFATDINNVMFAYIDRKKKLPVTTLLRAIGYESDKEILEIFNLANEVKVVKSKLKKLKGRKLAARVLKTWFEDFVDEDTGEVVSIERNEVLIERETIIDDEHIKKIKEENVKTLVLHREEANSIDYAIIYNTLQKDPTNSEKEAIEHIYRLLRSSEPPDEETARQVIEGLFFSDKRYDLGDVGRYRINKKLNLSIPDNVKVLTKEDIISIIRYLINLINSKADVDDIDHLSNRRVRTVGEQLYNLFGVGLSRMAKTIKERMNVRDNEVFTPIDLINTKTLSSVINSFFGTSQLSQFMDQTNPLAEMTHKRRMSALGPGGLTRERAGFEVRDVHYTHYGRLCTIETPEGPNIGLISSLCVYAKVNNFGFIETPYRVVKNGKVNFNEIIYLSAEEEEGHIIAQANAELNDDGSFVSDKVKARKEGDFILADPSEITLMDVAPNQISSIAASLIPFLEHDDANRALMGSNMQRQAVPLMKPEAPIVGTGIEKEVIKHSRLMLTAEGDGVVEYVDSEKIVIKYDRNEIEELINFDDATKTYNLIKFKKTNQNTTINQRPIVKVGQKVKKGDILCEGFGSQNGELALGRNLMVAFMPWKGFNFEDAIVISEKVVKEDMFTSIHIDEFSLEVKDTQLGVEEFTSDIPSVSEEATKDLDENGLVRLGAEVKEGDILIGKITPKGESDPTPEEKLLKAIFGDKAGDVKDASLRAKPSFQGVVIDKAIYEKKIKKNTILTPNTGTQSMPHRNNDQIILNKLEKDCEKKLSELREKLINKLLKLVENIKAREIRNYYNEVVIKAGTKFTKKVLEKIDFSEVNATKWTGNKEKNKLIEKIIINYNKIVKEIKAQLSREKLQLAVGDDLPPGTVKLAKVYVAQKRKLKVGDKLSGRHGNKGVIAKIVREEDMPFLEDGTPVDIVLNPLGVPSRMNLGQIYETVLGWAGKKLGIKFSTPIFDGASLKEIEHYVDKANLPKMGKTTLYDGETGQKFTQPVTVGVIYMMKLNHMVDDKMHARSIGPYSLITQQPLGGKAQFGGQRFGEMEVWALEAFGAANILQEILTLKSDDVEGRAKAYEAIVKGNNIPVPGIPESFKVLLHELRGLALNISLD